MKKTGWQGWSRDYSFGNFSNTGTLVGIEDIGYAKHFEFKPYGLGGFEKNANEKTSYPGKLGAQSECKHYTYTKTKLNDEYRFCASGSR